MAQEQRLGVDVGGVISDRSADHTSESFFGPNYLDAPVAEGAFAALAQLNAGQFADQIYIVSKCGEKIQDRTKQWFTHLGFYEATGIEPDHVHFCRERAEKAEIAKTLGLTHFIDDRLEILIYLEGIVPQRLLFNPRETEIQRQEDWERHLKEVKVVRNWNEVSQAVILDEANDE